MASYFVNYQHLLERMEMKTKANISEKNVIDTDKMFLVDGNRICLYSPEMLYLESIKTDAKSRN